MVSIPPLDYVSRLRIDSEGVLKCFSKALTAGRKDENKKEMRGKRENGGMEKSYVTHDGRECLLRAEDAAS